MIEYREPATFPLMPTTYPELKRWTQRVEAYLNDHFGARDLLIYFNSRIRYALGDSGSSAVAVGRSGWLFLAKDSQIRQKFRGEVHFQPDTLSRFIEEMQRRASWLRSRNSELLLVIIPNKSTIYPTHVPKSWTRLGPHPTDQLVAALSDQDSVHWLDLRPLLRAAAGQEQIYDKFDSHWNDKGCYLAYRAIMEALAQSHHVHTVLEDQIRFDRISRAGDLSRMLNLSGYLTEETWRGSVLSSGVSEPRRIPNFKQFEAEGYSSRTRYADAPSALILCDSFVASYMIKYLQESFAEAHFMPHNRLTFPADNIRERRPDLVIYICAERLIPINLAGAELR